MRHPCELEDRLAELASGFGLFAFARGCLRVRTEREADDLVVAHFFCRVVDFLECCW